MPSKNLGGKRHTLWDYLDELNPQSSEELLTAFDAYFSAEAIAARKVALRANMSEEERMAADKAAVDKAIAHKTRQTEHGSGDEASDEDSIAADDIDDPLAQELLFSDESDYDEHQRWQGDYMVDSEEEELDEDDEREGEKMAAQDLETTSAGYHALMMQMETNRRIYCDKKHQAEWTDADFERRGLLADETDKGGIFEAAVVHTGDYLTFGGVTRLVPLVDDQRSKPRWMDASRDVYEEFTYVRYKRTKEGFVLRDEDDNPVIEPAREGIVLVKYIKTLPPVPSSLDTMATGTHV